MLKSIGFRGTNGICSLKAHDSDKEQETERYLYVVSRLGTDIQYYDVSSSIYCVTQAINTGTWDPKDYYREMYGRSFEYEDLRDKAKKSYMSAYFIKSPKECAFHMFSTIHDCMHKSTEEEEAIVSAIQDKMRKALHGRLHASEIFLHETALYLHASLELTRRGWKVIQVYDGFYASHKDKTRNLKQEFNEILTAYVPEYVHKYVPETARKLKYIEQQEKKIQEHKIQQEAASFLHAHERMIIDFDNVHSKSSNPQKANDLTVQNTTSFSKQNEKTQKDIVEKSLMLQNSIDRFIKVSNDYITETQQNRTANQRRCLKTSKINIRNIRNLQDFRHTVKHFVNKELYQELFGDTERWFRQCLFEQEYCNIRHFSDDFFKLTAKLRKELFDHEK